MTGSMEAAEAIRMLLAPDQAAQSIMHFDALSHTFESIEVRRKPDCPACVAGVFEYLSGPAPSGPETG
jgi:hypothetical protein